MEETIFDKILAGEIPANKVFENEHVLAFYDINPQAPIHVLVIPKKKVDRLMRISDELSIEDMGHFLEGVSKTANILGLGEKGYRMIINNGSDGGQDVEYLHAHILGGRTLKGALG